MEEAQGENLTQTALIAVPSLAVAAHELKAPLALIRQLSLILRDEPDGTTLEQPDIRKLLERLTLTSERSLRLVEMLTKHARLDDGLFEFEPIHVGQICEEAAHEFTPLCKASGREIELHLPKRSLLAVANRDLLRSITLGLFDNALAYTQPQKPIIATVSHQGSNVRMSIRDNGPVIPSDTFRGLKERLGRSKQPIGGRPTSSGLGLYIAGQFADAMQGKLGVVRHRHSGTTFYLDTPMSSQLSLLGL